METYRIVLKNEHLKQYFRMARLILFLHLVFFIYYLLYTGYNIYSIAGILVCLLSLLVVLLKNKGIQLINLPATVPFLLLTIIWTTFPNFWMAAALVLLSILDYISGKKVTVFFLKDGIVMHSFPKRIIPWKDLNNALLKDRILTLDLVNDKLIQTEISEESYTVDESSFNIFCKLHLTNKD